MPTTFGSSAPRSSWQRLAPLAPRSKNCDAVDALRGRSRTRRDHDAANTALHLVTEAAYHRGRVAPAGPREREVDGVGPRAGARLRGRGGRREQDRDRERNGETRARHGAGKLSPGAADAERLLTARDSVAHGGTHALRRLRDRHRACKRRARRVSRRVPALQRRPPRLSQLRPSRSRARTTSAASRTPNASPIASAPIAATGSRRGPARRRRRTRSQAQPHRPRSTRSSSPRSRSARPAPSSASAASAR